MSASIKSGFVLVLIKLNIFVSCVLYQNGSLSLSLDSSLSPFFPQLTSQEDGARALQMNTDTLLHRNASICAAQDQLSSVCRSLASIEARGRCADLPGARVLLKAGHQHASPSPPHNHGCSRHGTISARPTYATSVEDLHSAWGRGK